MSLLFDGAAFCPSCGSPRSRSEEARPQATKCPACRAAMRWVQIGNVDLLECEGCDGTWIEADAFDRLCLEREQQSAIAQKPITSRPAMDVRPAERVQYRPCPQCGKLMNRQNFGRLSGTVVDTCGRHGTFLDRGELHQVVRFILEGGLDRMRQADLERLKEEQRRLKELELHLRRGRSEL